MHAFWEVHTVTGEFVKTVWTPGEASQERALGFVVTLVIPR